MARDDNQNETGETQPGGLNLDEYINRLQTKGVYKLTFAGSAKRTTVIKEAECLELCFRCRELFMSEPPFIEVDAPVNICGDTHGQFEDLMRMFTENGFPSKTQRYLFMGDYVDRGPQSLETVTLLMAYKLRNPSAITILRGNHESRVINRVYGFYEECKRRFPTPAGAGVRLWKLFQDVFNCMPFCALVNKRIFCMHGGLSQDLHSWQQLRRIRRPCDVPDSGILTDLLWADPDPTVDGYQVSQRGTSFVFGVDVVKKFCKELDIDLVARAHQVVENGYEFFADRQLVTIFSAPYYCAQFDNAAAIMRVDKQLQCNFFIFRPQVPNVVVAE